jgi:quinol monooxygenase YgiN
MISFIVRMTFASEDHDAIAEDLRQLTAASRKEPGCVSYIPHFVEGDDAAVLIYEQYKDEAALEFHRNSPHFQQYAVGGLYQRMRERELQSLTAVA